MQSPAQRPSPVGDTRPGLTYDDGDRPPFGADPKRRYDRRPSNPDARGLTVKSVIFNLRLRKWQ